MRMKPKRNITLITVIIVLSLCLLMSQRIHIHLKVYNQIQLPQATGIHKEEGSWLKGILESVFPGERPPKRHPSLFERNRTNSCQPQTHVAFMKTHKCASSTLQNILFRFGQSHGLNFVLPKSEIAMMHLCQPFSTDLTKDLPWNHLGYDVFAQHTRWDSKEIRKIMPPDTVYIGIVRDPVEVFESMYDYYRLDEVFNQTIQQYIGKHRDSFTNMGRRLCLGENQMLFDWGMTIYDLDMETSVKRKIKEIDSEFDLILIAERFDESLVLLRRLLCWDLADLTYLKSNFRNPSAKVKLSEEEKRSLRQMNWADQMLYDHFLKKFEEAMDQQEPLRMQSEVKELRDMNRVVYQSCVLHEVSPSEVTDARLIPYPGRNVMGYNIKQGDACIRYAASEFVFTNFLRTSQMKRALENNKK